jgi:hypothetical protein
MIRQSSNRHLHILSRTNRLSRKRTNPLLGEVARMLFDPGTENDAVSVMMSICCQRRGEEDEPHRSQHCDKMLHRPR